MGDRVNPSHRRRLLLNVLLRQRQEREARETLYPSRRRVMGAPQQPPVKERAA